MKYHLFIDESGDPSLSSINSDFPVFTLLGCLFKDSDYEKIILEVNALKMELFGSEDVILHSTDIRSYEGVFAKLFDSTIRERFYAEIKRILTSINFTVIAVVIKKEDYIAKYGKLSDDPYEVSLSFLLERAVMETDQSSGNKLEIVIESRGKKEDSIIQKRYNTLLDVGSGNIKPERFKKRFEKMSFRKKNENDCGLQIADLCAHPISRHILNPLEVYPPFDIVETKLRKNPRTNSYIGFGLKIFP